MNAAIVIIMLAMLIVFAFFPMGTNSKEIAFAAATPNDSHDDDECLLVECAEEDCCGFGTMWDGKYRCLPSAKGMVGFNGTHSDKWNSGCTKRRCINHGCCSPDTIYDETIGCCVMFGCIGGPGKFEPPEEAKEEEFQPLTIMEAPPAFIHARSNGDVVAVGIYAEGSRDEGKLRRWSDKFADEGKSLGFKTGKEILDHLMAVSDEGNEIGALAIFSHPWNAAFREDGSLAPNRGGVWANGGRNKAGLYTNYKETDGSILLTQGTYVSELGIEIALANARFSSDCTILLTACRVGRSTFAENMAKVTGCKVTAAMGASSPELTDRGKETGRWKSGAGSERERDAAKASDDLGFVEVSSDGTTKNLGNFIQVASS